MYPGSATFPGATLFPGLDSGAALVGFRLIFAALGAPRLKARCDMTRTITVTGGFTGSVVVDVSDSLKQLADATFRLALCPVGQDDPPPIDSASWMTATATASAGAAVASAIVDGTTATGIYNAAIDVVTVGQHETLWVADRRKPNGRALVVVT